MPIESVAAGTNQDLQQNINNNTMNEYLRIKTEQNNIIKSRKIEENSNANTKNNLNNTTTKTVIDKNNILVFTRYDEKGKEINRVPPGYTNKI